MPLSPQAPPHLFLSGSIITLIDNLCAMHRVTPMWNKWHIEYTLVSLSVLLVYVIIGLHTANLCLIETGITQLKYCQDIFQAILSPITTHVQLVWYIL